MNILIDKFNSKDGSFEILHTFTNIVNDIPMTFLIKWYITTIMKENVTNRLYDEVLKRIKISSRKQSKAFIEEVDGTIYFADVINDDVKLHNRMVNQINGNVHY